MTYLKNTLSLLLALLCLSSNAQNTKFSIRLETNVGFSDRIFVADEDVKGVIDVVAELEKTKPAIDFGLLAGYSLSKKVEIAVGVRYTDWGYQTEKRALVPVFPDPVIPDFIAYKSQNRYVEIPIRINYDLHRGKNIFYIWGGYFPSYNISNHIITTSYFPDETITMRVEDLPTAYEYRRFNMIAELGIGISKAISPKIGLTVGPNIRSQTIGIIKDAPLNRLLLFYGLSVGIHLK
ncbi:MAG: hypothetical protein AAGJ93_06305 [Bacteroidota bacterium]